MQNQSTHIITLCVEGNKQTRITPNLIILIYFLMSCAIASYSKNDECSKLNIGSFLTSCGTSNITDYFGTMDRINCLDSLSSVSEPIIFIASVFALCFALCFGAVKPRNMTDLTQLLTGLWYKALLDDPLLTGQRYFIG